jgi:hypothetical protein
MVKLARVASQGMGIPEINGASRMSNRKENGKEDAV